MKITENNPPVPVTRTFTLELTDREAAHLMALTSRVGGVHRPDNFRGTADAFYYALRRIFGDQVPVAGLTGAVDSKETSR
jgi:hypothetical protein